MRPTVLRLAIPGPGRNAQPLTTIEEMAALYVKQIRVKQANGPYFLGGYCMGGTVAYEAAQQLHASGETVALLAMLDTMNWHKVPLTLWSKSSYAWQQVLFHAANSHHSRFRRSSQVL